MLRSIFKSRDCISMHRIEIGCQEALNNCYIYTYVHVYVYVNVKVNTHGAESFLTS